MGQKTTFFGDIPIGEGYLRGGLGGTRCGDTNASRALMRFTHICDPIQRKVPGMPPAGKSE